MSVVVKTDQYWVVEHTNSHKEWTGTENKLGNEEVAVRIAKEGAAKIKHRRWRVVHVRIENKLVLEIPEEVPEPELTSCQASFKDGECMHAKCPVPKGDQRCPLYKPTPDEDYGC